MAENKQQILYSWEYEDTKDRSPLWYIIALSIAIGLIIWGFFTRQYGMSLVIMLVAGFFYFLENNAHDYVRVEITDLGIKIQDTFYDYARILGFVLVYDNDEAVYLRLGIKKSGIRNLNIRIDSAHAAQARAILANYIEEGEKTDVSFGEKLMHYLKL